MAVPVVLGQPGDQLHQGRVRVLNPDGQADGRVGGEVRNGGGSGNITIGSSATGRGTYELSGGTLDFTRGSQNTITVGGSGVGLFNHTAGTHAVGTLILGSGGGSDGQYHLSGAGVLSVGRLVVGSAGSGRLVLAGGQCAVSELLRFGPGGALSAGPGATIHMNGSAVENQSSDEPALAGLEDLELVFQGGPADWATFGGRRHGPGPRRRRF